MQGIDYKLLENGICRKPHKKATIKASAWKTIRKTQYDNYEDHTKRVLRNLHYIPKKTRQGKISKKSEKTSNKTHTIIHVN